jgi:hypothetical protein
MDNEVDTVYAQNTKTKDHNDYPYKYALTDIMNLLIEILDYQLSNHQHPYLKLSHLIDNNLELPYFYYKFDFFEFVE